MKRTLMLCTLVFAACSGSNGGGAAAAQVAITTQALEKGNVGHPIFQQMSATGGRQPYTWWVSASGDPLPTGVSLMPDGRLAGTPASAAAASVVVVVQDTDSALDLITYNFEVRDVEIEGVTGENLQPGTQLQLQAQGGAPGYTFSLSANQSGAQLTQQGSYTAGNDDGVDVLRATDADGFYEEVAVTVGDNPFVGFTAIYGSTDVWWVNWDVVYDPSPDFASDFDEVLAALGLRDPGSVDPQGAEADQLAKQLVLRRAMGYLSSYFGNSFDGGLLPTGLAISFPAPGAPNGSTPPAGGVQGPGPSTYNSICIRWGPSSQIIGTAWLDPDNDSIEHDCGDPGGTPLGIFANRLLGPYLIRYNNSISGNPVGAADVAGLQSLLQGTAPAGARESAIFDVADKFARVIAAVLAHEIGHSLGLNHSGSPGAPPSEGSGDIMNAALNIQSAYAFNPGHWATLVSDLPGPNR